MPRQPTFDELLTKLTIDLGHDAVGLWQLRQYGIEWFGLAGDQLRDFYRRTIHHLLAEGAVPVSLTKEGWWRAQEQVGRDTADTVEDVLSGLAGLDRPPVGVDAIWFGRRDVLDVR